MSRNIEDELRAMIVERLFLKIDPRELAADAPLADQGIDSVSLLELVVGIEELFGISLEGADFDIRNFKTIAAIAAYLRGKLPPDA